MNDHMEAFARIEMALGPEHQRDLDTLRVALSSRGGDAVALKSGLLRMTTEALYHKLTGGDSAPDLRFVAVNMDALLKESRCRDLLDSEDIRRIEAAAAKQIR